MPYIKRDIILRPEMRSITLAGPLNIERFWAKVRKTDDCWLWIGSRNSDNYGMFRVLEGSRMAHRVAWVIENGPIPPDMCVLHKCDNAACVRVAHLFLGTDKDNAEDRAAKGRNDDKRGKLNPNAKLTEEQIKEIRETPITISADTLAVKYGVAYQTIRGIRRRDRDCWRHV